MAEDNVYNVNCIKCQEDYLSTNKLDTDNEGYCPRCKEEKDKIAKEIDKKYPPRKSPDGPAFDKLPTIQTNLVPGGRMYNARDLF